MEYLPEHYCWAGLPIQVHPSIRDEAIRFLHRHPYLKAFSGYRRGDIGDHRCGMALDMVPDRGTGSVGYADVKVAADDARGRYPYVEPLTATWKPGNHHLHVSFERCKPRGDGTMKQPLQKINPARMVMGKTPDLSPATFLAALGAILAILVNAQWISGQTNKVIVAVAGVVIPLGVMVWDAVVRRARNQRRAHEAVAAASRTSWEGSAGNAGNTASALVTSTELNGPAPARVERGVVTWGEETSPILMVEPDPDPAPRVVPKELGGAVRTGRASFRPDSHPVLQAHGTFAGLALGKAEAKRDPRTPDLAAYLTAGTRIRTPRKVSRSEEIAALLGGDWGMMGNDVLGDCTCAALGHAEQTWTGVHGAGGLVNPTRDQVVGLYNATGQGDTGRVMFEVLKYAAHNGLFGRELGSYVSVSPRRYRHRDVKASIDLLGGLYLGVGLPETAQTQQVWDLTGDPTKPGPAQFGSWGGHAIWVVDYDPEGLTCVTWGALHRMTWAFLLGYADEQYAIIANDWLQGGKTIEGLDLQTLEQDLAAIRSGWQPPQ